jgi:Flp pilus assembly protein TadD
MGRRSWIAWMALVVAGCVSADQDRLRAYREDAHYQFQRGDYLSASEDYQAALALRPEDTGLLYNIGQCYERRGNAVKAEQYYRACLQRAPDHVACHHALTVLLVRNGRRDEAVQLVEDWLRCSPQLPAALAEDAWLYRQNGDLPRAQARLQDALLLDSRDWRCLTELGIVYEEMHRPDRSTVLYEQSLVENPNQPDVRQRLQELLTLGTGPPRPGE